MQKLRVWLLFLLVTALFYGSSIFYGFSQDDFFHLVIARADSLKTFLNFFLPHPQDWVFYRPLSTQLWYWLFDNTFGWWRAAKPMHIAALILHASNAYLISLLLKKVFRLKEGSSLLGGVLYAISSVHFLSLFYIGATQQLLTTFFGLLTILANLESKRVREITFFILSLLSKELAIRLVPILFFLRLIQGDNLRIAFKRTFPLGLVALLYLALRYLAGISTAPEYSFDFSPATTLATVMWYGLMTLGAPEQILSYGLSAGRVDFLSYLRDFPILGVINLISLAVLLLCLLITKWSRQHLLYALLWLSPLLPILFLPTHRYAHYLDLSLIPLLAILLSDKRRWLIYLSVFAFLTASVSGQLVDRLTHWTIKRARTAQAYTEILSSSGACQANAVTFVGSGSKPLELAYALMNENGPRIICNKPALQVYYSNGSDVANSFFINLDH